MSQSGPVFTRPTVPAAACLHIIRHNPIITRGELIEATGLSQPTITRATAALLSAGLIQERTDLTQSQGRGRPTVPLECADNGWMLAGIAIGTAATHIGLYDVLGRTIKEDKVPTPVAKLRTEDFIEHIMAGINRLSAGVDRTLVSVGVTTSGTVDAKGLVYAPNLGWDGMDIASRLRFQFGVPITVSSAITAILGSETQSAQFSDSPASLLVLYADDTVGAALADSTGVHTITLPMLGGQDPTHSLATAATQDQLKSQPERNVLDQRAKDLGTLAAALIKQHQPDTVVIAGGAFYDDEKAPQIFATQVRSTLTQVPQLRMIPNHQEIVRAIARAVALDPLLRTPLDLVAG